MRAVKSLRASIQAVMRAEPVPGLAAALIQDGALVMAEGFGVLRQDRPEPVTADTVFEAASLSKPVFAYAVLKLVEEGRLALDAPLGAYLPEPYLPGEPRIEQITARHVLSHRPGLPNWRPKDEALRFIAEPGAAFGYSGEGYVFLQRVVEHLAGQRLDEWMQARVMEPLGMRSSSYSWQPWMAGRAAAPYGANDLWKELQPNSAFSLYTTAQDFSRFLLEFLRKNDEESPISRESIARMLSPQVQVGDWAALAWGLGWGLQRAPAGDLLWHWGSNYGFRNYVVASYQRRAGLVILTNADTGLETIRGIVAAWDDPVLGGSHPAFDWLLPAEEWRTDGRKIEETS